MAGPFVVARNGVVIGTSARLVFEYLADMTRHWEWDQVTEFLVTARPENPPGVGSVLRRQRDGVMRGPLIIRGGMGDNPVRIVKTTTIIAFEPHNNLVFETRNSYNGLLVSIDRVSFHLQEIGEGTQVTMISEAEPMVPSAYIGPVYAIRVVKTALGRLFGNWLGSMSPGAYLPRIKEAVESAVTPRQD